MSLSEKVQGRHQDRLAMIYVRQSTLRQVEQHQESTRLQYALVERAFQLGWARQRVEVIDDDLGRSGSSTANRPGFQRLVTEVGLGDVGLVLGVEMSRLARSCRDWHQLLEICALFDTLIADSDGVYDASLFNDRLLLGLKGTMSEAELHILKARMLEGRRAKAQRGELFFNLPRGYMRGRSDEIVFDSDTQVQAVVRLVFETFERCRSINGVLHYLVAHDIRLPFRSRTGAAKGELEWHVPNRYTLSEMLQSPLYAGAYAYGRRRVDPHQQRPGQAGTGRRASETAILLKGRLPAYISWETYERNLDQVAANRSAHHGIPRGGSALLAGLVICGQCGQRMAALYPNGGRQRGAWIGSWCWKAHWHSKGARFSFRMPALPFKLNQDRRHHIPRQQHKVTNWSAYEAGLRQRGSLTVWFTDEAVAAWAAAPRTTRGGQPSYSPLAILTALTLRAVFHLAYRQAEGLIASIISLLGLTLRVPDHTTLSRRSATLAVPRPRPNVVGADDAARPLHLLVDSTGLKLCSAGEWLVEKHGTRMRRAWRKLHIGVDADTGQIVAAALTNKEVDDAVQVGPLLDQVTGSLASFTADGAYDQDGVYADVAERHPDAAVVVPPRRTAVPSDNAATAPTQRDRHLQCIAETSRRVWQKASGYNKRAKVEAAIGRWKQVIGAGLRSRMDKRRVTEINVAVDVLNRMLDLGRPNYVRIV